MTERLLESLGRRTHTMALGPQSGPAYIRATFSVQGARARADQLYWSLCLVTQCRRHMRSAVSFMVGQAAAGHMYAVVYHAGCTDHGTCRVLLVNVRQYPAAARCSESAGVYIKMPRMPTYKLHCSIYTALKNIGRSA